MTANIELSTVQDEKHNITADGIAVIEESVHKKKKRDDLQGFVNIFVRSILFEMVRATVSRSAFLWRLINDKPNSEDRFHHNDGDSKKFECLMNYLVKNRVPDILPCSVRDLYNETLFYGIDLPENNC